MSWTPTGIEPMEQERERERENMARGEVWRGGQRLKAGMNDRITADHKQQIN